MSWRSWWLLAVLWPVVGGAMAAADPPADADLRRATALFSAGQYSKALPVFEQCLAAVDAGFAPLNWLPTCLDALIRIHRQSMRYEESVRLGRRLYEHAKQSDRFDGRDLRDIAMHVAADLVRLGERAAAETLLQEVAGPRVKGQPADPVFRVTILVELAQLGEGRLARPEIEARWREAKEAASKALDLIRRGTLDRTGLRSCTVIYATACSALGEHDQAVATLEDLLGFYDRSNDLVAKREILVELAERQAAAGDRAAAVRHLEEAVVLARQAHPQDPSVLADLLDKLATRRDETGQPDRARVHWLESGDLYRRVIDQSAQHAPPKEKVAECLGRLRVIEENLGRRAEAIQAARDLLAYETRRLGAAHPKLDRVMTDLAMLYAKGDVGQYEQAEELLRQVVLRCRRRDRPGELAAAINNLAAVERAHGVIEESQMHFEEVVALHEDRLPGDTRGLATACNNLASVLAARGRYAQATELYQRSIDLCRKEGTTAQGLLAASLLNLAVLHRSQGQYEEAARYCQESLQLFEAAFGTQAAGLVDHHNALAGLAAGKGDFEQVEQHATAALRICRSAGQPESERAATALHYLATADRAYGRFADAERHWNQARTNQEQHGRSDLAARTLNNLGIVRFLEGRHTDAEQCFRQAVATFGSDERRPQDHYSSLCSLAFVLDRLGRRKEALARLGEAAALAENPRLWVTGAEDERAGFLDRFADAFDLLVEWNLDEGNVDDAFRFAEQGRSRTFLDQLRLAGIDLRNTLGDDASHLVAKERDILRRLNMVQARVRSVVAAGDPIRNDGMARELASLRQEHAKVWTEIRSASPLYRNMLATQGELWPLARVRQELLRDGESMLYYLLGEESSRLMLIGPASQPVEVFPLELPQEAASLLADSLASGSPARKEAGPGPGAGRGTPSPRPQAGPATREAIAMLVDAYVLSLRDPGFGLLRGPDGTVQSALGIQRSNRQRRQATLLGEVLLPPAARAAIRARAPQRVIVVPNGPLAHLPLEALVVEEEGNVRYALDILPPITYVPSANALASLVHRPPVAARSKVLTVGNPEYQHAGQMVAGAGVRGDGYRAFVSRSGQILQTLADQSPEYEDRRDSFLELGHVLRPLSGTLIECRRVVQAFGPAAVFLEGARATERNVVQETRGCRFIHLAAHGLVDFRHGIYGSIVLSPSAVEGAPDDDGLLSLHEIHALDLTGCELVVLSACETSVGRERGGNESWSNCLAQAFLTAGARRVLATRWSVSDVSTAQLVGVFFEEVARQANDREPIDYAESLRRAQRRVRQDPRWSSPFYWAPFVLLGPAR